MKLRILLLSLLAALLSVQSSAWAEPPILELTLTQGSLDQVTSLALQKVALQARVQSVSLEASDLALRLPSETESEGKPWELSGTLHLGYGASTRLAETSFTVSAQPIIEKNWLKLKPNWAATQVAGTLPFSFVLGGKQLGQYAGYLPKMIPIFDLDLVNQGLQSKGYLPIESSAEWSLATPWPGALSLSLSLSLSLAGSEADTDLEPLDPGLFRIALGADLVDRLLQEQVEKRIKPDEPIRPQPPIKVGKALFIPILVKSIYVRQLEASYSQGAFQFEDLTIDVGWKAGPLSGLEPLFKATGSIVPTVVTDQKGSYFSWQLSLSDLLIKSDKLPGNKGKLSEEFRPEIERTLGPELARKERISNVIDLQSFAPVESGELVVTKLEALDQRVLLEGSLRQNGELLTDQ